MNIDFDDMTKQEFVRFLHSIVTFKIFFWYTVLFEANKYV